MINPWQQLSVLWVSAKSLLYDARLKKQKGKWGLAKYPQKYKHTVAFKGGLTIKKSNPEILKMTNGYLSGHFLEGSPVPGMGIV